MICQTQPSRDVINSIPDPEIVRGRLAQALREVDLLRYLLRIAEKVADEVKKREGQLAP